MRVRFAGCQVPVDRRQRTARQRGLPWCLQTRPVPTKPFSQGREVGLKRSPAIKGLGSNNVVSSYLPMTNPVNAAIYAFGGFMLFAFAIGFFAAPV
jgi:hypothetical protein